MPGFPYWLSLGQSGMRLGTPEVCLTLRDHTSIIGLRAPGRPAEDTQHLPRPRQPRRCLPERSGRAGAAQRRAWRASQPGPPGPCSLPAPQLPSEVRVENSSLAPARGPRAGFFQRGASWSRRRGGGGPPRPLHRSRPKAAAGPDPWGRVGGPGEPARDVLANRKRDKGGRLSRAPHSFQVMPAGPGEAARRRGGAARAPGGGPPPPARSEAVTRPPAFSPCTRGRPTPSPGPGSWAPGKEGRSWHLCSRDQAAAVLGGK